MILTVKECDSRDGVFDGWVAGEQVVTRSRTPFFDAARVLMAAGYDPGTTLELWYEGDGPKFWAMRGSIGGAAKLTVKEPRNGPPRIVAWTPFAGIR